MKDPVRVLRILTVSIIIGWIVAIVGVILDEKALKLTGYSIILLMGVLRVILIKKLK